MHYGPQLLKSCRLSRRRGRRRRGRVPHRQTTRSVEIGSIIIISEFTAGGRQPLASWSHQAARRWSCCSPRAGSSDTRATWHPPTDARVYTSGAFFSSSSAFYQSVSVILIFTPFLHSLNLHLYIFLLYYRSQFFFFLCYQQRFLASIIFGKICKKHVFLLCNFIVILFVTNIVPAVFFLISFVRWWKVCMSNMQITRLRPVNQWRV